MRDIYDIVKDEIFDNINTEVKVLRVISVVGTTQKIEVCNNKWVRIGQYMTDSSNKQWKVIDIDSNGYISLTKPTGATDIVKRQILDVKSPIWLFGTHISANNEYLQKGVDSRLKLPIIWLVENIGEEEYDQTSNIERRSDIRVFFLDDNNPEQFDNVDYRQKVVSPMIALKDEFLRVINSNVLFENYGSCRTRPITRFGNEDEKGSFENILDENLSGVELRITLPINKSGNCKC
jgi:hypothetical protein